MRRRHAARAHKARRYTAGLTASIRSQPSAPGSAQRSSSRPVALPRVRCRHKEERHSHHGRHQRPRPARKHHVALQARPQLPRDVRECGCCCCASHGVMGVFGKKKRDAHTESLTRIHTPAKLQHPWCRETLWVRVRREHRMRGRGGKGTVLTVQGKRNRSFLRTTRAFFLCQDFRIATLQTTKQKQKGKWGVRLGHCEKHTKGRCYSVHLKKKPSRARGREEREKGKGERGKRCCPCLRT